MLSHIIRAGDRVRMRMTPDSRSYGQKGVPDGTLGTVVGRQRVHGIIEARYPSPSREPGIYSVDTQPIVEWDEYPEGVSPDTDEYNNVSEIWLEPADTFRKEYTERYKTEWPVRLSDGSVNVDFDMTKTADLLDNRVRTGDLPETPFWELDIVEYRGERFRITRIGYFDWIPERRHCYNMEQVDENNVYMRNGSTTVEPNHLTLIERGNVWKLAHGEKTVFHSLEEELSFASNTWQTDEIRNPESGLYKWTLEEVLAAIKADIVDGFILSTIPFSQEKSIRAMRFKDRNLGEKVRHKTMCGFGLLPTE